MEYDCSAIIKIEGRLKCKNGFIFTPSCNHNPMRKGVYSNAHCMIEELPERFAKIYELNKIKELKITD